MLPLGKVLHGLSLFPLGSPQLSRGAIGEDEVAPADLSKEERQAWQKGKKKEAKQRPIEEKESYRWLSSVQAVEQQVSTQQVLVVGDREADIYELFAQPRCPGVELLVRACEDRRVFAPQHKL